MKAIAAFSLLALAGSTTMALADQPGPDWISESDLRTKMEGQGYSSVLAEADDGRWEGEAIKDGRIVKFHADPRTGRVLLSEPKLKP